MKTLTRFTGLMIAALAVGCTSASAPEGNRPEPRNEPVRTETENGSANPGTTDTEPVRKEEVYPSADYSQDSPTDAMRTWVMATINKDVPALREILSADSLKMFEDSASRQGKTLGQILTGGAVENISRKIPEFRNERITGDTATVEYKDEKMPDFVLMPLVRENGKWKVAYDIFQRDLIRKLTEDMNNPAPKKRK